MSTHMEGIVSMKNKRFFLISSSVSILLLKSNGNAMYEGGVDQRISSNQAKIDSLKRAFS